MAQPLEHHLKLMIGDFIITVAKLTAENDALREQTSQAESAPVARPKARRRRTGLPGKAEA